MRRSSTTRSRCCSRLPQHPGLCRPSAARLPLSSCRCVKKTSPTVVGTPTSRATTNRSRSPRPAHRVHAEPCSASSPAQTAVIVSIETLDRVFNHHQRRAITFRDGGCIIPGCHVPPQWCEIHHVEEHSRGGPTHTDNGVLLCWFHHRTIDSGSWSIRMVDGVPHVRGPHWWDAHGRWRPATKSPTRMRDAIARRM